MVKPFIVQPGDGRLLDLGNFEAVVLADASATSGAFAVLQTQGEPPGFGPPLHVHRDAAEAFYVLEGTYRMHVEERQEVCVPGSFVYVPANVVHTFVVISKEPGRSSTSSVRRPWSASSKRSLRRRQTVRRRPSFSTRSARRALRWRSLAPCRTPISEIAARPRLPLIVRSGLPVEAVSDLAWARRMGQAGRSEHGAVRVQAITGRTRLVAAARPRGPDRPAEGAPS